MEGDLLFQIATMLPALVFAIVFHEIAHGWVAYMFGDPTAKDARRLSPNPIRHIDPIGTIGLPLILFVTGAPIFGWAKPVPVIAQRLRNPRPQMMLVALAGPGTNFLLALVTALLLALKLTDSPFVVASLINFLIVNIFLGVFNLLPLPPFDGGHVVEGLLPRPLAHHFRKLARWGFPILLFLLVILPMVAKVNVIGAIIMPPFLWVYGFYAALAGL